MKTYLHAFAMCQSMFCALPSPWQGWDEQAKDKILLFFPLIGLEIGILWAALGWLCSYLELPPLAAGILLCVYPYLVTGFMHLDGFMDVTDAVKSWRDLDRRREILKDSHVGSFSVIAVCILILGQFAFLSSAPWNDYLWILMLIPVVSRCGSALAVTALKPMQTSQYSGHQLPKKNLAILGAVLLLTLGAGFLLCGKGGFALLGAAVGYGLALLRAYRSLQGMNGDIAGFCLSCSELAAFAVMVLL